MKLKIKSPQWTIFEWEIEKITIPTESGPITVLPQHTPLVSVVKPWVISIRPQDYTPGGTFDYIFTDNKISISSSKGMVFIDGHNVSIVVSQADVSIERTDEELWSMKIDLEKKIIELRSQWSIEEVEKSLINLKKIEADLQLSKIKRWE